MNVATNTLLVDDETAIGPSRGSAATLLFTDIVGSTSQLERLGDDAWLDVLRRHYALVRGHVARHDGVVVQVLGDGFMVAFDDILHAVDCAVAIQRSLTVPDALLRAPLRVRMGIHSGPVIREPGDVHGRTVVLGARIAARADGEEILVSDAVASELMACARSRVAKRGDVALKGLRGMHAIYAVEWRYRPVPVRALPPVPLRRDEHRRSRDAGRFPSGGRGATARARSTGWSPVHDAPARRRARRRDRRTQFLTASEPLIYELRVGH
jgi:class 3 adenylate cyclase